MTTVGSLRASRITTELGVISRRQLSARGIDNDAVAAQIRAGRWQVFGTAVVLHNGPLSRMHSWEAARLVTGPRALLTAFTALGYLGLRGWEREEIHVLAPAGTARPTVVGLPIRLHLVAHRRDIVRRPDGRNHAFADAAVLAASTFRGSRPGSGLLAAVVQQRLTTPARLAEALARHRRVRHRRELRLAVADIAGGAEALSEIDFAVLCRRAGLPEPVRQAVRTDSGGRRRYLDAEWLLPDGRRVVAEVDGAVHLAPRRWWDDQLRQNAIVLSGAVVLRFPSVVVRSEPALVLAQLRQALRS